MTVALAAASAAAGASAQILPRAVALYPLAKGEGSAGADVQALLDVALRRAAQRNDDIAVTEPIVLRAACGAAPSASLSCLSGLAGPGLVLRARVQRSGAALVVAIDAIDAAARSFGPVSASVDDYIQNAEPLAQAILLLVRQALAAGPPPPKAAPVADATAVPVPPPPAPKAAPVADATAVPVPPPPAPKAAPVADATAVPLPPPPVPKAEPPPPEPPKPDASKPDLKVVTAPPLAAAVAAVARPPAPPRAWMRKAGPWMTAAGAALLAGGVTVSLLNRSLSSDLEAKHGAGTLTPADLSSYDQVEQYNQLATILYASGGALTLSGIAIWTAAPPAGRAVAVAGVSGRF